MKYFISSILLGLSLVSFSIQAKISNDESSRSAQKMKIDIVNQYVPEAMQVGEARMKYLWLNIYDAALYSPQGDFRQDNSFALQLDYLRKFEGDKIAERSIAEIKKQGYTDNSKLNQWLMQMKAIFPDVNKGDTLLGIKDEDGNTNFYYNGKKLGVIEDTEFSRNFFNIWLSDNSSYPELTKKLIGKR